jgi:EmrB/QacA subfamily drug resistance transporter
MSFRCTEPHLKEHFSVTATITTILSPAAPEGIKNRPSPLTETTGSWSTLAVLMAGTFMIVLDFFIVNVALPAMQADLHASASAIEWVVAGYGLTFATCLITAGRLGDRIGRRQTFSIGLALFTLASAACGLASTAELLIAARLVQGLAAALISPNVLAIIGVVYRGPERLRALTVYGMVMGFAALGAQLIGGLLMYAGIGGLGWRTVFLINLPVGIVALVAARGFIPESRTEVMKNIDLVGTALITLGLAALLLPLVEGRQQGWPTWTGISLAVSPAVLGAFVAYQRWLSSRGGAPLLDLSMFRDRTFSAGLVTQITFWCGQASFFLVLALYLQQGRDLRPLEAGLVFTVLAAAYLVTSLRAPKLTPKYGRDLVALAALTLAAGHGLLLIAVLDIGTGGPIALLAPGLVLVGAGMGLGITPLVSIVLGRVDPQRAGAASGALSTVQQLGNALGVAVTGVLFFSTVSSGYAQAFEISLAQLCVLLLVVAALSRLLPPNSAERSAA